MVRISGSSGKILICWKDRSGRALKIEFESKMNFDFWCLSSSFQNFIKVVTDELLFCCIIILFSSLSSPVELHNQTTWILSFLFYYLFMLVLLFICLFLFYIFIPLSRFSVWFLTFFPLSSFSSLFCTRFLATVDAAWLLSEPCSCNVATCYWLKFLNWTNSFSAHQQNWGSLLTLQKFIFPY